MRIAVTIIAVAFLYNFFTWYKLFVSSQENKQLAQTVSLADSQQLLEQHIANTALLLALDRGLQEPTVTDKRRQLQDSIARFEQQQTLLFAQLNHPGLVRPAITGQLHRNLNTCAGNFLESAKQIAGAGMVAADNNAAPGASTLRMEQNQLQQALEAINHLYISLLLEQQQRWGENKNR